MAFLTVASVPALGGAWRYQQAEDDPFKPAPMRLAGTFEGGHALAFRCRTPGDLALVVQLPDEVDRSTIALIEKVPTRLLVIVDKAPKTALDAISTLNKDGSRYQVETTSSEASLAVLQAALAGRQRIAVAIELAGQITGSQPFALEGAQLALRRLVQGCGLSTARGRT